MLAVRRWKYQCTTARTVWSPVRGQTRRSLITSMKAKHACMMHPCVPPGKEAAVHPLPLQTTRRARTGRASSFRKWPLMAPQSTALGVRLALEGACGHRSERLSEGRAPRSTERPHGPSRQRPGNCSASRCSARTGTECSSSRAAASSACRQVHFGLANGRSTQAGGREGTPGS